MTCGEGYVACNEKALESVEYQDYAICVPEGTSQQQESCPITAFTFDLETISTDEKELYQEVEMTREGNKVPSRSIWYSKSVLQHPIDSIRIQNGQPCADEF